MLMRLEFYEVSRIKEFKVMIVWVEPNHLSKGSIVKHTSEKFVKDVSATSP